MQTEKPYLIGSPPSKAGPLARYLPPVDAKVATAWLTGLRSGQKAQDNTAWILDPFGTSPQIALEAARGGHPILVAANNPIIRFILELKATPPSTSEIQAALALLASARKGDDRLEPHIRNLYHTTCDQCGQEIEADAFLWERGQVDLSGEFQPLLYARLYTCPYCGQHGEYPATGEDLARARRFSSSRLHHARALERVVGRENPDRRHVEQALFVYLPRAVYVLFTLINKLAAIPATSRQRDILTALLLTACDQANTLWAYPIVRPRPRQLTIPPRFRENNIWQALEDAIVQWAEEQSPVPLSIWPQPPASSGGICLYEGRLKEMASNFEGYSIDAVLTVLPRPNQAFWTLSALWAGWLWGKEAVGPFISVLRRRRYDWSWHCTALQSTFDALQSVIKQGTPVFALVEETEPGFLAASMVAAARGGFEIKGVALRAREQKTQIHLACTTPGVLDSPRTGAKPEETIRQAGRAYIEKRGSPVEFIQLQAAGLQALGLAHQLALAHTGPGENFSRSMDWVEEALTFRGGFNRLGGSDKSLEVGRWWLRDASRAQPPHSDRVEKAVVRYLIAHHQAAYDEIESGICAEFPGLLTPERELFQVCLESYAEVVNEERQLWRLRQQDTSDIRRENIQEMLMLLEQIAANLGFEAQGKAPQIWRDDQGDSRFSCYVIASAVLGDLISQEKAPPGQRLIVLPGSRANLVAHKLAINPYLRLQLTHDWRFVKYRQVRWLARSPILDMDSFLSQLESDPVTYDAPQIRLF